MDFRDFGPFLAHKIGHSRVIGHARDLILIVFIEGNKLVNLMQKNKKFMLAVILLVILYNLYKNIFVGLYRQET